MGEIKQYLKSAYIILSVNFSFNHWEIKALKSIQGSAYLLPGPLKIGTTFRRFLDLQFVTIFRPFETVKSQKTDNFGSVDPKTECGTCTSSQFGFNLYISACGCPPGWVKHEQSCYHFSHDIETWPGAYVSYQNIVRV
jgi:hypothetical protein